MDPLEFRRRSATLVTVGVVKTNVGAGFGT
jgi:hypothetical protein